MQLTTGVLVIVVVYSKIGKIAIHIDFVLLCFVFCLLACFEGLTYVDQYIWNYRCVSPHLA
jgi:hypothetical protein